MKFKGGGYVVLKIIRIYPHTLVFFPREENNRKNVNSVSTRSVNSEDPIIEKNYI